MAAPPKNLSIIEVPAVRITRSPLAGGADVVYEETPEKPLRRLLECRVLQTQTIGDQSATLRLNNLGTPFSDWASGDAIRIEVKRRRDTTWKKLLEGFTGEPTEDPLSRELLVPVIGPNSILDLVKIESEVTFVDSLYTAIFDTLCAAYLPGYTRTIATDPGQVTGSLTFGSGMKLREALDILRRGLRSSGLYRWEYVVTKSGAVRNISLYRRSSAVQATYQYSQALEGTMRFKGSAYRVVNRAQVLGATAPSAKTDKTGLVSAGGVVLDNVNDWVAQPFQALDTPLYAHTVYADRSSGQDPPALGGSVARNIDGFERYATSFTRRPTVTLLRHRTAGMTGSISNIDDGTTSGPVWAVNAVTDLELVVWDTGPAGMRLGAAYLNMTASGVGATVKLWGSDDDFTWTALTAAVAVQTNQFPAIIGAPAGPYRYYKLTVSAPGAASPTFNDVSLLEHNNLASPGPTNDKWIRMSDDSGGNMGQVSTTFGTIAEIMKVDLQTPQQVVKLNVRHSESLNDVLLTLRVQRSDNGVDWTDIAITAATGSSVIDNLYLEAADFRYLRLIAKDDRISGAAVTWNIDYVNFWVQSDVVGVPLPGDAMRGSAWAWDVGSLVEHPALMIPTFWGAPRHALIPGKWYWFLYKPQSGASNARYWTLHYGEDPASTEALTNGGFDNYPTATGMPPGWVNGGTAASSLYARDAVTVHAGFYSLKFSPNGVGTFLASQDLPVLQDGVEYVVRCRARISSSGTPRLRVWNVLDNLLVGQADTAPNTQVFEELEVRFVADATKIYRIDLKATADTPSAPQVFYFDSVTVHPADSPPAVALLSTNAGSTWAQVTSKAVLKHRTHFNNRQLVGEAESAASQAKYANFVPNGVLHGGFSDDTLTTQDMVDREAAALVEARSDVVPRLHVVVALDPGVSPGGRIMLDETWKYPYGTSGALDVMEAIHDVTAGRSTFILNDHPPGDVVGRLITIATRGTA